MKTKQGIEERIDEIRRENVKGFAGLSQGLPTYLIFASKSISGGDFGELLK